jgi:hypothetical protein
MSYVIDVYFWAVGHFGHIVIRSEVEMKESELIRQINSYLKGIPGLFFWKEHGGMYGTAGIPDIIVCYKGKFIAFEAKVGKNTATVLQDATIKQIINSGGFAVVVRSVKEVKSVIEEFAKE